MSVAPRFCSACAAPLGEGARFCAQCGAPVEGVTRRSFPPKAIALVLGLSAVIAAAGWFTQGALAGVKPTKVFERRASVRPGVTENPHVNDETLNRLRSAVENAPTDLGALKTFAQAALETVQSQEAPSSKLVLELVDALRTILAQDENDRFALIALADVSLSQRVVPEAIKYFERYLSLEPDDHVARSRYASALAFSGRSDEAIRELQAVIEKHPNDFQARAFLAVTYAQRGEQAAAIAAGDAALAIAPSDEARARFGEFLEMIRKSPNERQPDAGASSTTVAALEAEIRAHPIAGSKFERAARDGEYVDLYFRDFPMQAMPEAVREKFLTSVAGKAREAMGPGSMTIRFIDGSSGVVMAERPLP